MYWIKDLIFYVSLPILFTKAQAVQLCMVTGKKIARYYVGTFKHK